MAKELDMDQVLNEQKPQHIDIQYEVALKTVGDAPFFKTLPVRQTIVAALNQFAVQFQLEIESIEVFTYGLKFELATVSNQNIYKLMLKLAQFVIKQVNVKFPELNLKATAPNQVLSRLWHRPFYIQTRNAKSKVSVQKYLE